MIHLDVFGSGHVRHAFFTRQGGVSEGVCASLNCGFTTTDDASRVSENRARAMRALDLAPDRLATVKQVHGAEALVVETPWPHTALPRADALVTRVPDLALGILTADCVPILFADTDARVIGAAHAGWRGALAGIVEATVAAMEDLGASAQRTVAAIGPAIAQSSYEVGPEFPRRFLAQDPANSVFFLPSSKPGHFLFDLKGYVAHRLAALGIRAVADADADTAAEPDRFFSYRRACLRGELGHGLGLSTIALAP
ncbi:MAG TPA: peptidoglycan editing factor PgeF [Stellaceae bacterium]|nr:peptidoglycan editing factor PgeF [Stellaceae bacterium]